MLLAVYGILTDDYTVHILPLVLVFAYLVLFKLDTILLLLSFIVPLAIEFDDIGMGLGISLPDEPLVMLIMVLLYRNNYSKMFCVLHSKWVLVLSKNVMKNHLILH